jgi:hypothetical protein
MAAKKQTTAEKWTPSSKKSNPGVHAKSKSSGSKTSKNYKKPYRGQGR